LLLGGNESTNCTIWEYPLLFVYRIIIYVQDMDTRISDCMAAAF